MKMEGEAKHIHITAHNSKIDVRLSLGVRSNFTLASADRRQRHSRHTQPAGVRSVCVRECYRVITIFYFDSILLRFICVESIRKNDRILYFIILICPHTAPNMAHR